MTASGDVLRVRIAETARLRLRRLDIRDAAFMFELVNDRSWIDNIGERNVRTLEDARRYIEDTAIAMYERLGFGLYAVGLMETGEAIGICGLVKREGLDDVDLGFAFLPRFWGAGYALEASRAVLSHATETLGCRRVVAIVSRHNSRSIRLLDKLGFRFQRMVALKPGGEPLELHAWEN
ncbi:MAG TPA: GNAT family N-acetyltransferase [Casimicrobiaceae bacterium]